MPNCRKGHFKRHENKALARVLNDEAATCDLCTSKISIGDFNEHVQKCEEVEVQCGGNYGRHPGITCDWKGKRRMLRSHNCRNEIYDKIVASRKKARALCGGNAKLADSFDELETLLEFTPVELRSNGQVPLSPDKLYFELKHRGILLRADDWDGVQYCHDDSFLHDLLGHCDFGGNRGDMPTVAATGNKTIPPHIAKLYQEVIGFFTIKDLFSGGPTRNSLTVNRYAQGKRPFSMSHFISQGGRGGEPRKPEQWSATRLASFLSDCEKANISDFLKKFKHRVVPEADRFLPSP